jgi:hypothetical protein
MDFRIDVKGIDDMQKALKELDYSVDPNTFNEWADRIARTAKILCNDPNCKRIKIVKKGQDRVTFEFADKEAFDCVIESIEKQLNYMPPVQQEIYKKLKLELETKKREFKPSS